ncbi:MAG: glycerophosphodiester phosphodiesterase family protein [Bacteroidales bacterium]|jgi:glycerophosphoryl diester phosphodiesterase|nr:glycerophosphodiester phosphodiesterase family protein [Bacteroidales bacterium]
MRKIFMIVFVVVTGACNSPLRNVSNQASIANPAFEKYRYSGDGSCIVSGHRGGVEFPENSIEGFSHVLENMPAFFEIDPRMTKDSVIVLLHDATLDRTTTGVGKLKDYTWAELQETVRLKAHDGTPTEYKIPRIEDVIAWAKGKTIINLDKKDVPLAVTAALITRLKAEDRVMVTVHTGAQARFYYDRIPTIMMSVFCTTRNEFEDFLISGVPPDNVIAYVGPSINSDNRYIVERLHKMGIRCMISLAPTHDRLATPEERQEKYLMELAAKPDIIETDRPVELGKVLH